MTGKRFKEIYPDIIRSNYCFTDNGEPIGDKEVCDLLNEQHETIERLKDNCKVLDEVKCEIAEENERLRKCMNEIYTIARLEEV